MFGIGSIIFRDAVGQVWLGGIVELLLLLSVLGFGGAFIGEILVGQVWLGGIVMLLLLLSILGFW